MSALEPSREQASARGANGLRAWGLSILPSSRAELLGAFQRKWADYSSKGPISIILHAPSGEFNTRSHRERPRLQLTEALRQPCRPDSPSGTKITEMPPSACLPRYFPTQNGDLQGNDHSFAFIVAFYLMSIFITKMPPC